MARFNLYVVHLVEKDVDWIEGFYYFYNRKSAIAFIRKYDNVCFVSLKVYQPDCSGMYHIKVLPLCPQNS